MRRPIQIRRGTAAEWAAANPILRPGELGLETDTGRIKAAPGRAGVAWNSIRGYVNRAESRNRYAAKSLGGSSSTAGAFASFTWDPGQDVTVSFVYASAVAPSGVTTIFGAGSGSANTWNLRVTPNTGTLGSIEFRVEAVQRAISVTTLVLFDGNPHVISARVTGTTVSVTLDGLIVATGTFSSVTWASAAYFVGGGAASAGQRFPGAIWNLEGTDHGTAANGFTFLMDEPPTSTTYANSLSGSTAAATAAKGTGTAFPWVTSVASTDGRGMPAQPVGPLVYACYRGADTAGITGATTYTPGTVSVEVDPTGSLALCVWTAPAAGYVEAAFTGALVATTLAGTDIIQAQIGSSVGQTIYQEMTISATTVNNTFAVVRRWSVDAGEVLTAKFAGLASGDVYTLKNGWQYSIAFHPTPTTG